MVDEQQRRRTRDDISRDIRRLRARQLDKKSILTRLDPKRDSRQAQGLINEIAGLEGEIASQERKLRGL